MAELNENMVALLNALTNEDCRKLCHRVVDGLCGREPPHRGDYSTTWSLQEWLELLGSLTALFRLAVVNKTSDEVVFSDVQVLSSLSNVSTSLAEAVLSVLRAREEEIRCALLDRTSSISTARLQDFDWQLKCGCARKWSPPVCHCGDEQKGARHAHQFIRVC
ncbi:COMM domain-containing protein 8 isoform X3 [Archocentrus centrarchus]|uniref:COMM domain-containing protein 8 isoform X3 n=1 Tax=Archocentrus centrarchus TaxID=63155 RepID=UPI0011E9C1D5|nr:COMM domain-containing protein 8 isoform X3 [Archocentrus centrarchus]